MSLNLVPVMNNEEVLEACQQVRQDLTEQTSIDIRNPVTAEWAATNMNSPIQAWLSYIEYGNLRKVCLFNGHSRSLSQTYNWNSRIGRIYYTAKEICEQKQIEAPIGSLDSVKVQVGQIASVVERIGRIQDVTVIPSDHWRGQERIVQKTDRKSPFVINDVTSQLTLQQYDISQSYIDQVLVITGPPGSGKTTVAMSRLVYLIRMEHEEDFKDTTASLKKKFGTQAVFNVDTCLVLVRKSHLKDYLSTYAQQNGINHSIVQHLDSFLEEYAKDLTGAKAIIGREEPDGFRILKESIAYNDLADFVAELANETPVPTKRIKEILNQFSVNLRLMAASDKFMDFDRKFINTLEERCDIDPGQEDFEETLFETIEYLQSHLGLDSPLRRDVVKSLSEHSKALAGLLKKPAKSYRPSTLLFRFYRSPLMRVRAEKLGVSGWIDYIKANERVEKIIFERDPNRSGARREVKEVRHRIYKSDFLHLAALREIIEDTGFKSTTPLMRKSHIIIDEAQLMPSTLLRLIVEKWSGRMRSCTLVGDPRQIANPEQSGAATYFRDKLDQAKVIHLNEIHRVTSQQFDLMAAFAPFAGIDDELIRGRYAISGQKPQRHLFDGDWEEELGLAASILAEWQQSDPNATIVAVPCPHSDQDDETMGELLAEKAQDYGLNIDKRLDGAITLKAGTPVLTHIDSIIGLEFDYLLLFNTGEYTQQDELPDRAGSLWIALSRIKKHFLLLENKLADSVFNAPDFCEVLDTIDCEN